MTKMLLAFVAVALVAVPSFAQDRPIKDQLLGTWKVVNLTATSEGKVTHPLGDQVAGYVSITPTRIWLLFVDSTRKPPAAPSLTDAEAVAMMKSHVAWTGEYSTGAQASEGIKLTARVDTASSQVLTGTDRVYFMTVEGDKLTMKSPGVIVPMTGKTSVVEIELVKAD
jgi:Lipocalin-like domain